MNSEDEIRELIEASGSVEFGPFGHGTSEVAIANAENELGVNFPPSYVWWLRNYAGGEVGGAEIYSVYDNSDFVAGGDIVYMHKVNLRETVVAIEQLYICEPGSSDEAFFFKLDEQDVDDEYPVYRVDYLGGFSEKYAENFFEFLKKFISEAN